MFRGDWLVQRLIKFCLLGAISLLHTHSIVTCCEVFACITQKIDFPVTKNIQKLSHICKSELVITGILPVFHFYNCKLVSKSFCKRGELGWKHHSLNHCITGRHRNSCSLSELFFQVNIITLLILGGHVSASSTNQELLF